MNTINPITFSKKRKEMAKCCGALPNPIRFYEELLSLISMKKQRRDIEIMRILSDGYSTNDNKLVIRKSGVDVKPCCIPLLYGFSKATMSRILIGFKNGDTTRGHNYGFRPPFVQTKGAIWRGKMSSYFELRADVNPVTGKRHLPPITRRDVYKELSQGISHEQSITEMHFRKIWRKEYKDVVNPPKNRLGKCDTCVKFIEELAKTKEIAKRNEIQIKQPIISMLHNNVQFTIGIEK